MQSTFITPLLVALSILLPSSGRAGSHVFGVRGDQVLLNGEPFKVIGLRCSNALISEQTTRDLIGRLPHYREHGVNTVSVFFMGSRFGDVKGYRPDASLDPVYAARMGRIIEAADNLGMVVLVGCLYWSDSRAKEDLVDTWKQEHANRAVANTVRWLRENNYRNVFVDPDNEGMAHDATGWSIAGMIDAGHAVDPRIMIAYNDSDPPARQRRSLHPPQPEGEGQAVARQRGHSEERTRRLLGKLQQGDPAEKTNGAFYNYSRIGRYTKKMKAGQLRRTEEEIRKFNGYMLASTWLQCPPTEGVGGPFAGAGRPLGDRGRQYRDRPASSRCRHCVVARVREEDVRSVAPTGAGLHRETAALRITSHHGQEAPQICSDLQIRH